MKTTVAAWLASAGIVMSAVSGSVLAAEPSTRLVVGFPPGGTTDVIARLVAQKLSEEMDRSIIVENRPGASGNIAAGSVARATPDGSTLLFVPSSHATNATLYDNQNFDPIESFRAVGMVAVTPYVLVVHPEMPVANVTELVDYLRANPGKVEFASASPGTGQHLAGELFKIQADVDILHVPYKGSAAAMPDLISGRVPMMFDNIAVMLPHIRAGAVKGLAITAPQRSSLLGDTPTVAESGLPEFEVLGWFALLAPADTPDAVIAQFEDALSRVTADPGFAAKLAELGAQTGTLDATETDAFVRDEVNKWGDVIRAANISLG